MLTVFFEAPWHMARKDITLGRKPGYTTTGAPVEPPGGTGWTPEPGSQGLEKGDGHITDTPQVSTWVGRWEVTGLGWSGFRVESLLSFPTIKKT